jgi:hypothetical protein
VLNAVQIRDLSAIAINAGPGAGHVTLRGYTDAPGSIVTSKATQLSAPVVWTPVQTNAVAGGNYSFTVPIGGSSAGFFRTMYTP